MNPLTELIYDELGCNVTPTEPGYCEFFDRFGCHAYMGGRSCGRDEWAHREHWTTCCDMDIPDHPLLPLEVGS